MFQAKSHSIFLLYKAYHVNMFERVFEPSGCLRLVGMKCFSVAQLFFFDICRLGDAQLCRTILFSVLLAVYDRCGCDCCFACEGLAIATAFCVARTIMHSAGSHVGVSCHWAHCRVITSACVFVILGMRFRSNPPCNSWSTCFAFAMQGLPLDMQWFGKRAQPPVPTSSSDTGAEHRETIGGSGLVRGTAETDDDKAQLRL